MREKPWLLLVLYGKQFLENDCSFLDERDSPIPKRGLSEGLLLDFYYFLKSCLPQKKESPLTRDDVPWCRIFSIFGLSAIAEGNAEETVDDLPHPRILHYPHRSLLAGL